MNYLHRFVREDGQDMVGTLCWLPSVSLHHALRAIGPLVNATTFAFRTRSRINPKGRGSRPRRSRYTTTRSVGSAILIAVVVGITSSPTCARGPNTRSGALAAIVLVAFRAGPDSVLLGR
jgi:hypothetical protein